MRVDTERINSTNGTFEDVTFAKFLYPVFTRVPVGVTIRDSGHPPLVEFTYPAFTGMPGGATVRFKSLLSHPLSVERY